MRMSWLVVAASSGATAAITCCTKGSASRVNFSSCANAWGCISECTSGNVFQNVSIIFTSSHPGQILKCSRCTDWYYIQCAIWLFSVCDQTALRR